MSSVSQGAAVPQDFRNIVNKNTQQRKRKRAVLNLILLLLFLLLLIGIGFLTYFVVYRAVYIPPKEVVLDVNFDIYSVQDGNSEHYGHQTFKFNEGDDSGSRESKCEQNLPATGYLKLDYKIKNVHGMNYNYTIDFSDLQFDAKSNCKLEYQITEGDSDTPSVERTELKEKTLSYTSDKNVLISLIFSVNDNELDAHCFGDILFTIAVA